MNPSRAVARPGVQLLDERMRNGPNGGPSSGVNPGATVGFRLICVTPRVAPIARQSGGAKPQEQTAHFPNLSTLNSWFYSDKHRTLPVFLVLSSIEIAVNRLRLKTRLLCHPGKLPTVE